jgi:phage baseplate assembly protein gpV
MDDLQRLIQQVADLERRLAMSHRHGVVHEIKDGKVRVRMGEKEGGQPWLSPWLYQGDTHSGNVREETPYKVGQNVTLLCPNGDISTATMLPYAPSKNIKRPDHANDQQKTLQWDQMKGTEDGNLWERRVGDYILRITTEELLVLHGDSVRIRVKGADVFINPG